MSKTKNLLVAVSLMALAFSAGSLYSEEHGHGQDAPGPHGGEMQELGDKDDTHVELVRDEAGGKLTLYLLGKDQKTPVFVKQAPKINLKAKEGNKQVEMTASQFEASDPEFKADPMVGRISIELDGKKYQVKLDAHEGHDHGK